MGACTNKSKTLNLKELCMHLLHINNPLSVNHKYANDITVIQNKQMGLGFKRTNLIYNKSDQISKGKIIKVIWFQLKQKLKIGATLNQYFNKIKGLICINKTLDLIYLLQASIIFHLVLVLPAVFIWLQTNYIKIFISVKVTMISLLLNLKSLAVINVYNFSQLLAHFKKSNLRVDFMDKNQSIKNDYF